MGGKVLIFLSVMWLLFGILLQFWGGKLTAMIAAALMTAGLNAGYNLYKAMYNESYSGPTPKWGDLSSSAQQTVLIIGVIALESSSSAVLSVRRGINDSDNRRGPLPRPPFIPSFQYP